MVLTVLCLFIPHLGMVLAATFGLIALGLIIVALTRGDRRGLPLLLTHLGLVPLACGLVVALEAALSGSAPSAPLRPSPTGPFWLAPHRCRHPRRPRPLA
jgi:hypothetical protein